MIIATDIDTARSTRFSRRTAEGSTIWRSGYFGPEPSPTGAGSVNPDGRSALAVAEPDASDPCNPQCFLVEQEPGAIVHPHFHFVDQFQVAVDGDGTLGRQPVGPLTVHFAGAHTGYGPIVPGATGLKYFTARAQADGTGAQFLPAARSRMRPIRRRNVHVGPLQPSEPAVLAARREAVLETPHAEPDGLAVHLLRLPPGGRMSAPSPAGSRGQTLWVAAGALRHAGKRYPRWSAFYISAEEPAFAVEAEAEGVEVLVLQYPGQA